MTITRTINGKNVSIELTDEELSKAFWERQDLFYREDVENNISDGDLLEYGIKTEDVPVVREGIVHHYTRAMLNSDEWWDVLMTSVSDFCREWEKAHKEVET